MEWNDLAYLLEVSRSGSLSGAAYGLDVATSTLARRLAALEQRLGLRLLDRRPDGVRLTAHGDYRECFARAGHASERMRVRACNHLHVGRDGREAHVRCLSYMGT